MLILHAQILIPGAPDGLNYLQGDIEVNADELTQANFEQAIIELGKRNGWPIPCLTFKFFEVKDNIVTFFYEVAASAKLHNHYTLGYGEIEHGN